MSVYHAQTWSQEECSQCRLGLCGWQGQAREGGVGGWEGGGRLTLSQPTHSSGELVEEVEAGIFKTQLECNWDSVLH